VSEVTSRTKSNARMVPASFRLCLVALVLLELVPSTAEEFDIIALSPWTW